MQQIDLTGTYAPGVYCVRVWDIGNLVAVAAHERVQAADVAVVALKTRPPARYKTLEGRGSSHFRVPDQRRRLP